jgi:ABC-2 type transport system ATP-binding protein
MKDVEALCRRAIIIDGGRVRHDGPLAEIVERFNTTKVIEVQFAGAIPTDLSRYGSVIESTPPKIRIQVPRQRIPEVLSTLLSRYSIDDVGVEARPLEEVIAELFTTRDEEPAADARKTAEAVTAGVE